MIYDSLSAPRNKSIWAVAYSINDDTDHHRLMCKPTNGELVDYSFVPYKIGTKTKRASGRVSKYARKYADTYEEAVDLFNSLVQKRIDNLLEMAEDAKKDFIK
jgi:hypothetical protein